MKGKHKKGQALIETAIVLPILLIILFLFISVALFIFDKMSLEFAANKALDKAIGMYKGVPFTDDEIATIKSTGENAYNIKVFAEDPMVDVSLNDDTDNKETTLEVNITSKFNCSIPLIGDLFKGKEELSAEKNYIYKDK